MGTSKLARAKNAAMRYLDADLKRWTAVSRKVWAWAEEGFQEERSSALMAKEAARCGLKLTRAVAGMKTAWIAEAGQDGPVIALLAEFDALPGLSQKVATEPVPLAEGAAGHGCGHNLLGTASLAGACAAAAALAASGLKGRVRLLGTPAEEGGAGKVYMVRAGCLDGVDAAIHYHPGQFTRVLDQANLAVLRAKFAFKGRAAHASAYPEKGRSALDAVELMNVGANYLREHLPETARIHYVTTRGGERPNIVPDAAEVYYYVRSPNMDEARAALERLRKIADGAALMTETCWTYADAVTGTCDLVPNRALATVLHDNLRVFGAPAFDDADRVFARRMLRSYFGAQGRPVPKPFARRPLADGVSRAETAMARASTDVGDVSWIVPTSGFSTACRPRGIPGHSWGTVAASGHPMGEKGMFAAARVMAATVLDLVAKPAALAKAKAEFDRRRRGRPYRCPIAPGVEPPESS